MSSQLDAEGVAAVESIAQPPGVQSARHPALFRRNVSWNVAGLLWSSVVAFISLPFIVRALGTDGYGVLTMLTVVTNYVWFLDLGIGQATVKYIAEHAARDDWHSVRLVFWASVAGYVIIGLLAAIVMFTAAPLFVERWFRVPLNLQPAALLAFRVGSIGLLLALLSYGPTSVMRGLERFDLLNKVNIVAGTAQPLLTILLLVLGQSLPVVIIGNVAIGAVTLLVNSVIAFRLVPRLHRPAWDRATFAKMLRFGSFLSGSSLVVPILLNLEKFLLAGQATIGTVSYYMVPHNLASRLAIVPSSIGNALFPAFSNLHGRGEIAHAAELSVRSNRMIFRIVFPMIVIPLAFSSQLLGAWMGTEFAVRSSVAFQLLLLAGLANAMAWTPHMLVVALGRPNLTLRAYLIELVVCAPLTFFLVRSAGVDGAALAWFIRAALDAGIIWLFSCRVSGLSYPFWKLFADSRTPIALLGAGLLWVSARSIPESMLALRIVLGLAGLLFLVRASLDDVRQLLRLRAAPTAGLST